MVTPQHLATNPRLVKEAMALTEAGFAVHLVFTQHVAALVRDDLDILESHPSWTYQVLNWSGNSRIARQRRFVSGLVQKSCRSLRHGLPFAFRSKRLLNRHYAFQLQAALECGADLYIAHNAGALPVAAEAARRQGAGYAFDAEDFHRGQQEEKEILDTVVKVEDQYLPGAAYISAASPLIAAAYQTCYQRPVTTILNTFPAVASRPARRAPDRVLRLFWFSQAVGTNRGLQDVFRALRQLEEGSFRFDIYGSLPAATKQEFDALIDSLQFTTPPSIQFIDPVPPDALLQKAADYDIGFAIEPGFCRNNEIALSNKIFTYLAGGNAIIFSATPAQAAFFQKYPGIGFLYKPDDIGALSAHLKTYLNQPEVLCAHRHNSRQLFEQELNWENEKKKFVHLVQNVLS